MIIKFERKLNRCGMNRNTFSVTIPYEISKAFNLKKSKKRKVKMYVNEHNNLEIELGELNE